MKSAIKLFMCVCLVIALNTSPVYSEISISFIRVLKPYPTAPRPGVDPRVDVIGVVVNSPETTDYTQFLHWPKNDGDFSSIDYYYNFPIPNEIIDFFGYQTAVQNSFQAWEDLPDSNIKFNFISATNIAKPWVIGEEPWAIDNMNIVSFDFDGDIAGFSDSELLGKTLLTWKSQIPPDLDASDPELIDCDIILNASLFGGGKKYTWSLTTMNYNPGNNAYTIDVQSILTHEIGHLLGIAHPFNNTNLPPASELPLTTTPTMYNFLTPRFTNNLNMRTLETFDQLSAAYLYPNFSDGNDNWQDATPIGAGTLSGNSITANDQDWYVTFLEAYDSIKVVLLFPNNDLDLFLTFNPASYNPSSPVEDIPEYPGAEVRADSDSFNSSSFNEYVYAHTVTQAGNYYILVKGRFATSAADYTLNLYVSKDGDGDENSSNKLNPIPAGDGMDDSWEIAHGFNPTQISDGIGDADNDGLTNFEEFALKSNPNDRDTDHDEMPDGWETDNMLNLLVNDALNDQDNDGFTNVSEYIARTNPNDPLSSFVVENIQQIDEETGSALSPGVTIQWLSQPTVAYEILYTDGLENSFQALEEFLPGNEFQNGIVENSYLDQGYPLPGSPDAGTLRTPPHTEFKRLYKVRVKTP
ncbi:hypothetical protein KDK77_01135 [bacterium]|nr:hypothetical protein [bacterium]MCP5461813.1 hypothetical protein [bacterium]